MAGAGGSGVYNYLADSGETHIVRLRDETLTLNIGGTAQVQPAGPATSPFWAEVNRGSTEYGLRPRAINVCFTTTAPGNLEVGRTYSVVVLTLQEYGTAIIGSDVTYQGETARIVGKRDEDIYPGI